MSQFLLLQQLFAAEAEADSLQLQLFFKVAFAVWCSRELAHAMLPLTPFLQLRRLKALRRGLVFCVALAIVLLLTRELNVQQRVCDIRDWEFASSIFNSPKLVSRGPMLLHSANGSCTITWESFSRTSLHLTHPKQPLPSQFSAANIWFKHNIGLMEAPFGCVWNVSAICEVYHFQLASCPRHVAFRICSVSSPCLSFTFNILQPQLLSDSAQIFIIGDSQRGQTIFERHLTALSSAGSPPQMLLHLGDTAQRANIDGDWDQRFFGPLKRSNVLLPLLLVQGNHDVYSEVNASKQYVPSTADAGDVMVNPSILSYQGTGLRLPTYFATSLAGVRWIVVDTNIRSGLQLQWLRDELQSPSATSANFRMVCMHIPPWIEFWDWESWGDCDPDSTCDKAYPLYVRTHILPILLGGGVDVVLSGHQHNYQRGLYRGIVFVTSGGGGGGLDLNRVDNHSIYAVTQPQHHHIILNVTAHMLSFVARNLDGTLLDDFQVHRQHDG